MFDFSDTNIIVTGILILLVAWSLRRSFREQARIRNQDPLEEAHKEIAEREQNQLNRLDQMEVKLYEYGREVESRSDDRLMILDQLLKEADKEINRLRTQLASTQQHPSAADTGNDEPAPDVLLFENAHRITEAEERKLMIIYLSQAGFSAQEISNCFHCDQSEVETIIAEAEESPGSETA